MKDRHTIRRNAKQKAELELFMKTRGLTNESDAYHAAVSTCNNYIENVTKLFFPPDYDLVLVRKRKTRKLDLKVYDG